MKKILLLTFISIFSIQGAVITREGMIATANQYIPPINEWTPVVDKTSLSTKWQSEYKIKKNGGYIISQDEGSSLIFGMPKSAIDTGNVDKVLSIYDMPDFLEKLCKERVITKDE